MTAGTRQCGTWGQVSWFARGRAPTETWLRPLSSRRSVNVLKEHFANLLDAERAARDRIADAEREAARIVEEARGQRAQRMDRGRADAQREAEEIVNRARVESDHSKAQILVGAKERADAILNAADGVDFAFVQRAARDIAGLGP